jgi:aryl-alcohol dehydrogenase-like predicted oxidoreductase
MASLRRLGKSEIEITPIGLGCWQFSEGTGVAGGFWSAVSSDITNQIVAESLKGGINWFDTAQVYGRGRSERGLARALVKAGKSPGDVVVATKWWPMMRTAGSIKRTIDDRLNYLEPFPIDLHQVHHPFSLARLSAQMKNMADLVEAKKIRAVGISNFSAKGMRRAHALLAKRGLPLVSNQVKYSMLDRRIERNGVLKAAKDLSITIIAYSPLEQGILTGKFHDDPSLIQSRPWMRRQMPSFRKKGMDESRPVIDALKEIAKAHSVTSAQVALHWLTHFHGDTVVAIPGASKAGHVKQNVGAMGFTLSDKEMERLDTLSRPFMK